MKKENKKLYVKALLLGILAGTVGFLAVNVIQGNSLEEMKKYVSIYIITVVYFGISFVYLISKLKKEKALNIEEKERKVKRNIEDTLLVILVIAAAFLICLASQNEMGIKICISFIVVLGIIEIGLYMAHQNLKKDIKLINERLKEKNSK